MKTKLTLIGLFIFLSYNSFAEVQIKKVVGKKVLIVFEEGDSLEVEQEFFAVDDSGKKKAIIKIKKIKDNQAVADILKGATEAGQKLIVRAGAKTSAPKTSEQEEIQQQEDNNYTQISKSQWGILGGYLMNKMAVSFPVGSGATKRTVTADMAGNGFSLLAYYDYTLGPSLFFRASGGLDQFIASTSIATADCNSSTTCNISINYLSGYGHLKYQFGKGKWQPWLAAGVGFLFPISKNSTVFSSSDLNSNYAYTILFGLDYKMNKKNSLPIIFDYTLFPTSASVNANMMSLKFGWQWN